jgi:hypothetical protein
MNLTGHFALPGNTQNRNDGSTSGIHKPDSDRGDYMPATPPPTSKLGEVMLEVL